MVYRIRQGLAPAGLPLIQFLLVAAEDGCNDTIRLQPGYLDTFIFSPGVCISFQGSLLFPALLLVFCFGLDPALLYPFPFCAAGRLGIFFSGFCVACVPPSLVGMFFNLLNV